MSKKAMDELDKIPFGGSDFNIVAGTSTLVDDLVCYSSWDTLAGIYSLTERKTVFSTRLNSICYARPALKGNRFYVPVSEKQFSCIDIETGNTVWSYPLKGRCGRFDLVNDSLLFASVDHTGIVCLDAMNGKILYQLDYQYNTCALPDLAPWPVSFDGDKAYVANWECRPLTAIDLKTGEVIWTSELSKEYYAGKPILYNEYVFIGMNKAYEGGKVMLFERSSGNVVFEGTASVEERLDPVLHNDRIFFYSYDKKLNAFDPVNKKMQPVFEFNDENDASGSPVFLVDGALFFTSADFQFNSIDLKSYALRRMGKTEKIVTDLVVWNGKPLIVR